MECLLRTLWKWNILYEQLGNWITYVLWVVGGWVRYYCSLLLDTRLFCRSLDLQIWCFFFAQRSSGQSSFHPRSACRVGPDVFLTDACVELDCHSCAALILSVLRSQCKEHWWEYVSVETVLALFSARWMGAWSMFEEKQTVMNVSFDGLRHWEGCGRFVYLSM